MPRNRVRRRLRRCPLPRRSRTWPSCRPVRKQSVGLERQQQLSRTERALPPKHVACRLVNFGARAIENERHANESPRNVHALDVASFLHRLSCTVEKAIYL